MVFSKLYKPCLWIPLIFASSAGLWVQPAYLAQTAVSPVPTGTIPRASFVDHAIFDRLQQLGVRSAPLCTDAEFVRRIYLDLNGAPAFGCRGTELHRRQQALKTVRFDSVVVVLRRVRGQVDLVAGRTRG